MNNRLKLTFGIWPVVVFASYFALPSDSIAASWTALTNAAPAGAGVMLQLTDGTVMIQNGSSRNWMRLTPDAHGSYANGVWTANPINPMSFGRLYFASEVLPDGRVWVLGGEYTGPFLDSNDAPSGEIWDPATNTWSPIAAYPNQSGCGNRAVTSNANTAAGSDVITGIYSTDRFQVGWTVTGPGIPAGSSVVSVDSSSQVHISQNATSASTGSLFVFTGPVAACFGDDPSMLLSGGQILAGNIANQSSYIYSVASNTWSFAANKFYRDQSDEEGWVKLPDDTILTYDIFQSIRTGTGYAELFNPRTGVWSSISPADGTASGTLPVLSSSSVGFELGPILRLQDGRVFVIGANNRTALYTPSTNSWAAGPNIFGTVGNAFNPPQQTAFGADDAPAAITPNGHVLFAADAGPGSTVSSGNTTAGSLIITNLPSTAGLQAGWKVAQADGGTATIPSGTTIVSVDSQSQIHLSRAAAASITALRLVFGGTFSPPTQLFDFDPGANTISPVSPAIPDPRLTSAPSFVTRMLVLPNGQILFSDGSSQLWVYSGDGAPNPALRPVLNDVSYNGGGLFTITGQQLNGQSAGSSYGDDVESDENYPIIRLASASGNVYYCRSMNWSSQSVAGGSAPQTVNFELNPAVTPGNYALIVSGAGISSFPLAVQITQSELDGR